MRCALSSPRKSAPPYRSRPGSTPRTSTPSRPTTSSSSPGTAKSSRTARSSSAPTTPPVSEPVATPAGRRLSKRRPLPGVPMRAALFVIPSLIVAGSLAAQQPERYQLQGEDVAVYNLVGAVSVEAGTGEVAVELTRTGRDAAKLRVEQGEVR